MTKHDQSNSALLHCFLSWAWHDKRSSLLHLDRPKSNSNETFVGPWWFQLQRKCSWKLSKERNKTEEISQPCSELFPEKSEPSNKILLRKAKNLIWTSVRLEIRTYNAIRPWILYSRSFKNLNSISYLTSNHFIFLAIEENPIKSICLIDKKSKCSATLENSAIWSHQ